jgi:ABC-2 type transport system permease protein
MGYASTMGLIYSSQVTVQRMQALGKDPMAQPVEMVSRSWYNPDLRSQNVIIPGIIAIVMVVIAAMLTSVTIAREWETGTMEQLISTPLKGPELVFGKVIPYFLIGMTDVAIAVTLGKWLFRVPIVGNAGLLFAMAAIFLSGALFWGMTLSIVLKSQVLANQIAIVSGYLPTLILSGFVFAIENMPLPIQIITYIVPARYFIAILRGIYMKGIGLEILFVDALLLTLYAAVMILIANKKLKFKLE